MIDFKTGLLRGLGLTTGCLTIILWTIFIWTTAQHVKDQEWRQAIRQHLQGDYSVKPDAT